jgi:signal transduction histidine kinase
VKSPGSQIARARRRLWAVTFTVMSALSLVLVYVSSVESTGTRPIYLPSRSTLTLGLLASILIFGLYVFDTERKLRRLAERLTEEYLAGRRLEQEQEEQRDFVSMAAHELRAPLTAIKGFTRTLMTRFAQLDEEKRTAYLSLVNEQSNRLARLVDDLMAVSKIDSGRITLERAPVDVPMLVRSVIDEFRSKWTGRVIEVVADEPLAPALADRHRTEEVLVNLIDNTVKYSPASEPVTVAVAMDGGTIEVSVRDRGDGMTSDEAASLFTKFHRLPSAMAAEIPGTGLGLYIVRGLIEAQGGSVRVHSAPGEGSTFSFMLPRAETSERTLSVVMTSAPVAAERVS